MVVQFCPGDFVNVPYPSNKLVIKSGLFVSVEFYRDVKDDSLVVQLRPLEMTSLNSDQ